jgi:glycosyltransferase 2 family protein
MTKKKIINYIGIVVSLIFVYFTLKGINYTAIIQNLKKLTWTSVILICILRLLFIMSKAFRFKILLNYFSNISYKNILNITFYTNFFNIIAPFRTGEIIQVYLTKKYSGEKKSRIAGIIVLNKFIEFFSLLIIFYITINFFKVIMPKWISISSLYILISCLTLILIFNLNIIKRNIIKKTEKPLFVVIKNFLEPLGLINNKIILLKTFFISVTSWGIELIIIYITLRSFNVAAPIWLIVLILTGINFAIVLPSSAGIGPYEYAVVSILMLFGTEKEEGLSIAITMHFIEILLVIGVVFFVSLWKKLVLSFCYNKHKL